MKNQSVEIKSQGGKRAGAGRRKGVPNKATAKRREIAELALESGLTPLDYMLQRMRDEKEDPKVRQAMSIGAAPYVHPRLASIEHSGGLDLGIGKCSDAELDERIRQAAAEAAIIVGPSGKGAQKP